MHWITAFALGGLALTGHPTPFACNPAALAPAERHRHFEEVGPALRERVVRARELPAGYAFEFASTPETNRLLAEWAVQEAACCPFFDVEVRLAREAGPVELRLTGREGTKHFIEEEFGERWLKGAGARGR